MGNDPKQGEDFVKCPAQGMDDVEGHKQGIDPKQGEDSFAQGRRSQGIDEVRARDS